MLINSNMRGWQRRGPTLPRALILAYYAKNPLVSKRGPEPTWSYADESDPLVVDGGVYCGPGYTNVLPAGSEDVLNTVWSAQSGAVKVDSTTLSLPVTGAKAHVTTVTVSPGDKVNFSVLLAGSGPIDILLINQTTWTGIISESIVLTSTPTPYNVVGVVGVGSTGVLCQFLNVLGAAVTVVVSEPQVTPGPYLHPYIPPGTSTVSRAGTVGGNGIGFDTSGDTPKSLALRQAFEGKPDGVELAATAAVERSGFEYDTFAGDIGSMEGTTDGVTITIAGFLLNGNIGDRVLVSANTVVSGVCSLQRRDAFIGPPSPIVELVTTGKLAVEYTITEVTPALTFTYAAGQAGTISVTNFSVQKLKPAVVTATALVTPIGSDELNDGDQFNVFIASDVETDLLTFGRDVTGSYLAVSDGITEIKAYTTWDRSSHILAGPRTNDDGSQFQLGYKRYNPDGSEIDSAIQWSALTAFDGSFNPEDYLRLALLNTVPLSVRALEVWGKSASDDEILKYIEKKLPIPVEAVIPDEPEPEPSGITPAPEGATLISNLPYTINAAGDYKLASDLTINSGAGVTIDADGVALYGEGAEITYGITGIGDGIHVNADDTTDTKIYDVVLTQGASTAAGYMTGIRGFGGGQNHFIKGCTFNVVSRENDINDFGVRLSCVGTNEITECTFNLSGVNRFYGFRGTGAWHYHHNTANVSNHTCPDTGEYPFIVYVHGDDHEYDNNTFNVAAGTERINVLIGLGSTQYGLKQRANIHHNTVNYASDHGRIFTMDTGTRDWIVSDNNITITSAISAGNSVSAIRARMESGGSDPSTGHLIHSNTIVGLTDMDTMGISIGDSGVETDCAGIDIYNNSVKVAGIAMLLYSGACGDIDIYSNYFESTSTRYDRTSLAIGGTPLDIMISNNQFYTSQPDGDLLQVESDLTGDVIVCDCGNLNAASDIRGGGMVSFTVGPCQNPWLGDPVQEI